MYKSLKITTEKASNEMGKLRAMDKVGHPLIVLQIEVMDRLITTLICDHNYTPTWKEDYERLCDNYYEPIRVRNTKYISASEFPFSSN